MPYFTVQSLLLVLLVVNTKGEWDPDKSKTNLLKHGTSFDKVLDVFKDFHITTIDYREYYGETRYCTMGFLGDTKKVVLVAHTKRKGRTRPIKENKREQKIFYKARKKSITIKVKTEVIDF